MKEIINEQVSSRPISVPDASDVTDLQATVDKIQLSIDNLETLAEAFEKDENWMHISRELHARLIDIAMGFFSNTNPTETAIEMKYATAWGQFNEILKLTAKQIGVKAQIQRLETEKMSVTEKIKKIVEIIFKQNEKGK